jgi:hypothetical protein
MSVGSHTQALPESDAVVSGFDEVTLFKTKPGYFHAYTQVRFI